MAERRQTERRATERNSSDRRTVSDRRKGSESRRAVFEVCRSVLHLAMVVSEGNSERQVVTRSLRWRDKSTALHTDLGAEELTNAFRALVNEERLTGARVRFVLSGEYCVTRVVSGATDDVRKEFAELEDRCQRYLLLGPGSKAVAHSMQQIDARHQLALLSVTNQRTLDMLMKIADKVGLQIEAIEPSLTALSRAQYHLQDGCKDASLIIQLDEDNVELGICHRGQLLLDYRPGGKTGAENIADIVSQHYKRLSRYLDRYHKYLDAPLRHVYLTGDPAMVERSRQGFARHEKFKVEVLDPAKFDTAWEYMGEIPGTEIAASLGTAMLFEPTEDDRPGPNLIERMLTELREPLRPFLIRAAVPLAAVLLIVAGLLVGLVREKSATSSLSSELDSLAAATTRATELRLTMLSSVGKLVQLQTLDQKMPHPGLSQMMQRIAQSMPEDVWLDQINVIDSKTASLVGASYTDGGVYDFVGYLKQVPGVEEIALEGTGTGQSPTGPTTSFDLILSLTQTTDLNESEGQHD